MPRSISLCMPEPVSISFAPLYIREYINKYINIKRNIYKMMSDGEKINYAKR